MPFKSIYTVSEAKLFDTCECKPIISYCTIYIILGDGDNLKKVAVSILLLFITYTAFTDDQVSSNKGPLISNNIYPFYVPFINLSPERAKVLMPGEIEITLSEVYANTFNYDRDGLDDGFQLDMDIENSRSALGIDLGVSSFLEIGLELSFYVQYGGFMDSLIQGFHDLLGFANAGRDKVANNQYRLAVINNMGTWIELTEPSSGIGDIIIKSKLKIISNETTGFFLSIQPAIKLPTGSTEYFISSGKVDYAVNLLMDKTGYNYGVYLNLGWSHLAKPDNLLIFDFTEDILSFAAAYEWLIRGGWSILIQVDGNTSPYNSSNDRLDHQSSTINLGFKKEIGNKTILQFSFFEEFFTFATTDVGFVVGLVFKL
jgi:hypothetical protein